MAWNVGIKGNVIPHRPWSAGRAKHDHQKGPVLGQCVHRGQVTPCEGTDFPGEQTNQLSAAEQCCTRGVTIKYL